MRRASCRFGSIRDSEFFLLGYKEMMPYAKEMEKLLYIHFFSQNFTLRSKMLLSKQCICPTNLSYNQLKPSALKCLDRCTHNLKPLPSNTVRTTLPHRTVRLRLERITTTPLRTAYSHSIPYLLFLTLAISNLFAFRNLKMRCL